MTSLSVARCQRPCVSSLRDFGPPGAMIHVPRHNSQPAILFMCICRERAERHIVIGWKQGGSMHLEQVVFSVWLDNRCDVWFAYFAEDGPHSWVFENRKSKCQDRIEWRIYSPFCHTLFKLTCVFKQIHMQSIYDVHIYICRESALQLHQATSCPSKKKKM